MRKTRLLLALPLALLLAGCVNDSASYLIDGRDHALTDANAADVKVDLYSAGDGLWNVRIDQQLWQIETQTCNGLTELQYDPKADLGQLVGSFIVKNGKLEFDAAPLPAGGSAAAPAEAPAADAGAEAAPAEK
jgi:hypothetical protein